LTVPIESIDFPYGLTRNPEIIPRKRRKGLQQATSSTRRDPSHWELLGRGGGKSREAKGKEQAEVGGHVEGHMETGAEAEGTRVKLY
jgi:hypothetical protein